MLPLLWLVLLSAPSRRMTPVVLQETSGARCRSGDLGHTAVVTDLGPPASLFSILLEQTIAFYI